MSYAVLQRKSISHLGAPSNIKVGPSHDSFEAEADRVADRVTSGGNVRDWSISKVNMGRVQRDGLPVPGPIQGPVPSSEPGPGPLDDVPKPNDYAGALAKFAEAFAKTDFGKGLIDKIEKLAGEATATFAGKALAGSIIAETVGGLALAHKGLPFQVPEIPLGFLSKKLDDVSVKLKIDGPLNSPTDASIVFSFTPGAKAAEDAAKKRKKQQQGLGSAADRQREATARESQEFHDSLIYPAGSKEAIEKQQTDAAVQDYVAKHLTGGLPKFDKGPAYLGGGGGTGKPAEPDGLQLTTPPLYQPYKGPVIKLLDHTLELKPLQRKPVAGADAVLDTSRVERVLSSGGRSLDTATRSEMEGRFGYDFSKVKLHTGTEAAASAQGVQARAYTVGTNVVFGSGTYAPTTSEGRRLLAHELTHVVQQSPGLRSTKQEAGRGQHA